MFEKHIKTETRYDLYVQYLERKTRTRRKVEIISQNQKAADLLLNTPLAFPFEVEPIFP